MRRLGRGVLRSPWARRAAALTVALGLLGGNSALAASSALAATRSEGLLGLGGLNLGLGGVTQGLFGGEGSTSSNPGSSTLAQRFCQLLPLTCGAGTRFFEIPTGVATLGSSAPPAPTPAPSAPAPQVGLPGTGCLLGLLGSCGQPSSSPKPTVTPAASASATSSTTTTTTSTATSSVGATSPPAKSPAPAATPTPAPSGGGLLGGVTGLLGGLLGPTSNSTPTTAPTPASAPLCVLSCNLLQLGGTGSCALSALSSCVLSQAASAPTGGGSSGGSGAGSGSSGVCVGTLCLLGTSCTASLANTCLLGALLPSLPGLLPGSGSPAPGPTGSSAGGSSSSSGGSSQGGTTSNSTGSTTAGIVPLSDIVPATSQGSGNANSGPTNLTQTGGDEQVGLVSGISFGHGLILWPLFGLLDLAALAGLVVVVRRRWSATPG